jgi:L-cysteine S-thiosulfotransferase
VSGRDGGRPRRPLLPWTAVFGWTAIGAAAAATPPVEIVGDSIPKPLSSAPGDPARCRAIVVDRSRGLCLLCHSGPFSEERFQGNLAPDLSGAGARWSEGQLRLRMVDSSRLNPDTVMPAYYRTDHLKQVARPWNGKTVLTAQEIEDVISFLKTLQ